MMTNKIIGKNNTWFSIILYKGCGIVDII